MDLSLDDVLKKYTFGKVNAKIIRGSFTGYIIGVKLPVEKEISLYLVEENKAKRYLAKFNSMWMMSIPLSFISELELIGFDEISEKLVDRRFDMFYPE